MDNVSSLECLKFDSESEVLAKDDGVKNLFSPAMIPLICDMPTIGVKPEESETEESEDEESEDEESEDEEIGSKIEESESEDSEDEEITKEKLRSFIGECKYCLHVGDHISQLCPYKNDAPKNATIGESCMVVCSICCCLLRDSCCADCDLSIGCAVLKDCPICGKQGERWPSTCSKREGKHIPSGFTCDFDTGFFLPTNVH
ncbi:uncharacterized protein LOC110769243 [Prunus avium]|uniref:Uncharacterized protein LOC110769243 n=1 Tax=Prunus avium TaxID=42229 RepID=A0A6P5TP09_PRUAV|nr:uncharacterized protein LOC110769243 [Prunus avium]